MDTSGDGRVALVSSHPTPQVAAGELLGAAFEAVGPTPDLVIVAAAGRHRRQLETLLAAADDLLAPGLLIGVGTSCLASPLAAAADGFGILALSRSSVSAHPVSFHDDGRVVTGLPSLVGEPVVTVLGDAASCSLPTIIREIAIGAPGAVVTGGLLPRDPDAGARADLWLGGGWLGGVHQADGALVLTAPGATPVGGAQGLRPVGPTRVVTAVEGAMVLELDGRPAADVVAEDVAVADPRPFGAEHLVLARVADVEPGSVPVSIGPATPVLGVQRARRAIAVGGDAATAMAVPPWLWVGARVCLAEDHPRWLRDELRRRPPAAAPIGLAMGDADGLTALGVVGDVVDEVLGLRVTSVVGPTDDGAVADGGARLVVVGLAGSGDAHPAH